MWPNALMQLIELAPHVTRLVPMADRYLQSRAEGRDTERRAVEHAVDGLRRDLALTDERMREDFARAAGAQAGIAEQLAQQGARLERVAADVQAVRRTNEALDERLTRIETRQARLWTTLLAGLILLVIFVVGVVAVFAVLHSRQPLHGS